MHTPKSSTLYELDLSVGPDSLDKIIREKYDRRLYVGQQTGEMIGNDTYLVWDFSDEDDVLEQVNETYGPDGSGNWVHRDFIREWLDKPEPVVHTGYVHDTPETWKGGYWAEADTYAMDYMRDAPEPNLLLAELIRRGEMPYGRYLIHCWW